jgi:RecA/RadA recombinase
MSVADHESSRENIIPTVLNGKYGLSVGDNTSSNSNCHLQEQSMTMSISRASQQASLHKESYKYQHHNKDHHHLRQPSTHCIVGLKRPWQETKSISDGEGDGLPCSCFVGSISTAGLPQQQPPLDQQRHHQNQHHHHHKSSSTSNCSRRNATAEASRTTASAPTTKTHPFRPISAFSLLNQERTKSSQQQQHQALHLIPPSLSDTVNTSRLAWLKLGHGITELAGEAGSGKSQIAMSLCVHAVMKQQKKAVYISLAGGQASLSRIAYRMQQIANAQQLQQSHVHQSSDHSFSTTHDDGGAATSQTRVLSQILTYSVRNQEDLFSLLRQDLPLCLKEYDACKPSPSTPATVDPCTPRQQQHHRQVQPTEYPQQNKDQHTVALVVLDSIADLFRLGNSDNPDDKAAILKRSYLLFDLAAVLKELSDRYQVPILVINQVTADFVSTGRSNNSLPALGLSWANCVNAAYIIRRDTGPNNMQVKNSNRNDMTTTDNIENSDHKYHSGRRHVFLAKSAKHAVNQNASFIIGPGGVEPTK